jgi:uncharacterized protein YjiS (DUF1127 family)
MNCATIGAGQRLAAGSRGTAGRRQIARAQALRRLIAWFRKERRVRHGIDEMMALDDRLLDDIGLTRGSIEHAARYGTSARPITTFTDGLAAQPGATHNGSLRGASAPPETQSSTAASFSRAQMRRV